MNAKIAPTRFAIQPVPSESGEEPTVLLCCFEGASTSHVILAFHGSEALQNHRKAVDKALESVAAMTQEATRIVAGGTR